MPLWMLKIVFALSVVFVILPFAFWDAARDVFAELKRDYRDMVDAVTGDDE